MGWTWKGNINYHLLNEINNANSRHKLVDLDACIISHSLSLCHIMNVAYSIQIVEASQSFEFYWYKTILWDFIVEHKIFFSLPDHFNCRRCEVWNSFASGKKRQFFCGPFFLYYIQPNSTFDNTYCFPKCTNKRISGRPNFLTQLYCIQMWIEFAWFGKMVCAKSWKPQPHCTWLTASAFFLIILCTEYIVLTPWR